MAVVQCRSVLKPLRVLLSAGPMAGLSDGELLGRFLEADRDEAEMAFSAIVDRHGPMVRRLCRQLLLDLHDSEDAFHSEGMRYRVRNLIIEGNSKLKTEKLCEGLELHSGKPFTMAVKEADKNRMQLKYTEIGHINAQIVS